jgi:hypothetical protein
MHKSATKCNETLSKWCKNKHGASKIIDTLETYHAPYPLPKPTLGWRPREERTVAARAGGTWPAPPNHNPGRLGQGPKAPLLFFSLDGLLSEIDPLGELLIY